MVFINTGKIIPKSRAEVQFLKEEEGVSVFPSLSFPVAPPRIRLSSVESARQMWRNFSVTFPSRQTLSYPSSQADFGLCRSARFFVYFENLKCK